MTWRESFFEQARCDYAQYRVLNASKGSTCHQLHFLQMATEKLAKAFLCAPSNTPPAKTHYAIVQVLNASKGRPEFRKALGYEGNYHAYCAYIDSLLEIAEGVEKLAPVGANTKVNPEYPWKDDDGEVQCPARYAFSEFERTKLVKFNALLLALFRVSQ